MTRLLPFLTLALATGCATNFDRWEGQPYYGEDTMNEGTITARIATDSMPHVGTMEDDSRNGYAYVYDGWMDLSVDAVGDYGWAMLIVSGEADPDGWHDVIGCTGPEDGYAEYDEPAEDSEVTIVKTELDGELVDEIRISATFSDGSTAFAHGYIH